MTRIRLSAALCALTLALAASPSGAPALAQDSREGVAPPSSRSPALRDPTRAPSWRRVLGTQNGVTLPELRLRGRVVSRRGAVALLEIDQQLHVVRRGDQITLRLNRAAAPPARGRRGAQPGPARGPQTLTLRIRELDARALVVEVVELSQSLTLR